MFYLAAKQFEHSFYAEHNQRQNTLKKGENPIFESPVRFKKGQKKVLKLTYELQLRNKNSRIVMHNPPGLWSGIFALLLVNQIQNGRKKLGKNLKIVVFHAVERSLTAVQIAQTFLGLRLYK